MALIQVQHLILDSASNGAPQAPPFYVGDLDQTVKGSHLSGSAGT